MLPISRMLESGLGSKAVSLTGLKIDLSREPSTITKNWRVACRTYTFQLADNHPPTHLTNHPTFYGDKTPMSGIAILHATVGTGHKTAALALEKTLQQRGIGPIWCEDALDYGSKFFKKLYVRSYLELSEDVPELWAYFYEKSDQRENEVTRDLRTLLDRFGAHKLDDMVAERRPDAIICTHFLPLNLLARQKRIGRLSAPLYCVVTDYTGHVYWVDPMVDRYFVATPETGQMLQRRGIAAYRITITGIPVNPDIARPKAQQTVREAQNINAETVITLLGGGLHVERVRQMVAGLLERNINGALFVVAGRNKELLDGLADLQSSPTLTLNVLGFVDYLDDLIAASDLVITKAGGLIVSEILGRQRPMLVIDPIPGQEEWNADYIVSIGAGTQIRLPEMVPMAVKNLLARPDWLADMEASAKKYGRPNAANSVIDKILETVSIGN